MNANVLRSDWPEPTPSPEPRKRDRFDSFEGVQRLARRRLPRSLFVELATGAGRGVTLRENIGAFDEIMFCPRAAVYQERRDLGVSVLGTPISLPVLIDPIGGLRLFHPSGQPRRRSSRRECGHHLCREHGSRPYDLGSYSGCDPVRCGDNSICCKVARRPSA